MTGAVAQHKAQRNVRPRDRTLAVAAGATLVVLVAFTTTITTVGATAQTFGAGTAWQTWLLSAMSLGLAGGLLTAGSVADIVGHRRVLRAGSAGLALASALAAVAPSILVLVIARVLQGIAGAAMLSASLGRLGDAYPSGAERTRATGAWGAALAAGIALGPVLAAAATDAWSWRAAHWLTGLGALAVAAATGAAGAHAARDDPGARLDLPGAVCLLLAMGALVAGITSGRSDWGAPATLAMLGAGIAGLGAFAVLERLRAAPMLDLSLLRHAPFLVSIAGALVTGLAVIALMSYVPVVLERGLGESALAAAAVLAAWSATSMVTATQTRRLPERLDARRRLIGGLVISAGGAAGLASAGPGSTWWALLPGLLVAGVGSGVVNAALARLAVQSVPAGSAGLGSGANNTARYLGSAIGIAVVVALVSAGGPGPSGLLRGFGHAALYAAAANLAGAALALVARR